MHTHLHAARCCSNSVGRINEVFTRKLAAGCVSVLSIIVYRISYKL